MSAIPAELRIESPWRSALPAVFALVALTIVLYRDTALEMIGVWSRSETFTHGFLVAPISAWLIWRRRDALRALTPRPQPWALAALFAAAAAWLLADLVVVNAAAQFAFVALLVLAVPAALGMQVTRAILFPLAFLFFAVPFGEFMLPSMMQWTADFAVLALQASGVPVYREGLHFVIPSGQWSVVEECSGVRYLIASAMVGSLFAYLNYRSARKRALFMAASLLVPILANWLRAYLIVMLGHLSGNKLAAGVDHILYGWLFFGVIIAAMFIVGARWADRDEPASGAAAALPRDVVPTRTLLATVLGAAVIVQLPQLVLLVVRQAEAAVQPPRLELPDRLAGGWSGVSARPAGWSPKFANPSLEVSRAYAGAAGTVTVHVAYYRGQSRDRKLVSSIHTLVHSGDPRWNQTSTGTRTATAAGRSFDVRTARIVARPQAGEAERAELTAWRFYWIDGRYIASDAGAKIAEAGARLRGRGDDGALIVVHAEAASEAASDAVLKDFVHANAGTLDALLRAVRDTR